MTSIQTYKTDQMYSRAYNTSQPSVHKTSLLEAGTINGS